MPSRRTDIDDIQVANLYQEQGLTATAIGQMLNASTATILERLNKSGVLLRKRGRAREYNDVKVCRLYRLGVERDEIMSQIGITNSDTFYKILKRNGVKLRSRRRSLDCPHTQSEILRLHGEGLTRQEIAEQSGVNRTYVIKFLKARGLGLRKKHLSVSPLINQNRFDQLQKRVDTLLVSSAKSDALIARECGCLVAFVRRERAFLRKLGRVTT